MKNSISIQSKASICDQDYTVISLSHFVYNIIMVDQEVIQCDLGGHSSHTASIEHFLHATQDTVSTVSFRLSVMLTVYTFAPF